MMQLIVLLSFFLGIFKTMPLWAFPENVRHGYSNCGSCHVNPTGGGVLSEYGRRSSEDFMFAHSEPNEADFANGLIKVPQPLLIGGDVRFLSLYRDNGVTRSKLGFPMQADVEVAAKITEALTLDASLGIYDSEGGARRFYALFQPNEAFYTKVGKFFPAYGILMPDHAIGVRKELKFNEGQEGINAEFGYVQEHFEIIADLLSGRGGEEVSSLDRGLSLRFAYNLGASHQIGINGLRGQSEVWQRNLVGVFALLGLSEKLYLLLEADREDRKPVDRTDFSLPTHRRFLTFTRLGWEFSKGWHVFSSIESLDPVGTPIYTQRKRTVGPGVQWLPRPHWEVVGQWEKKLDEGFAKGYGDQATLMTHVYF